MRVPQDYVILHEENTFELRKYRDMVLAKVLANGPFENAHKLGGQLLQDYLDGNNNKGHKIVSKAPFMLRARPDGWEVSCILPRGVTLATAPAPRVALIQLEEVRPRPVAVVKFHGKSHYSKMMKKTEELKSWAKGSELKFGTSSRIVLLRSPFLPFLRKNEIHLEGIDL